MTRSSTATSPGRPRDPDVDRRILTAAVDLFGETGWSGFSIEGVARGAGVGKASIYLRWSSKEELLLDALNEHVRGVVDVRPGTVREELLQLIRQLLTMYLGLGGRATLRLAVEPAQIPGVAEHWEAVTRSVILAARAIVRRAVSRGELPSDTSVTLVLDTLAGGAMNHVLTTPPEHLPRLQADPDAVAEPLVDFVLAAARHVAPPTDPHTIRDADR